MSQVRYRDINFRAPALEVIEHAVQIAEAYSRSGDSLTLRQLYYRFVAGGLIANRDTEYKRLGSIINDARYAGLFDWSWITDRTRNVRGGDGADTDPKDVVQDLSFYAAMWEGQLKRVEVWVEKDALVDVVGRAAGPLRTPYFSCRGYTSSSEIWAAAQRLERYFDDGAQEVVILHLGDHDPSGIDMSRDIDDRLNEFLSGDGYGGVEITRIALNMDQVRAYDPPPNPAKITDSRATGYIRRFGGQSWELDALEPTVLRQLITTNLSQHIDFSLWVERLDFERQGNAVLAAFGSHFDEITGFLESEGMLP